jgi:hypothetical protein
MTIPYEAKAALITAVGFLALLLLFPVFLYYMDQWWSFWLSIAGVVR